MILHQNSMCWMVGQNKKYTYNAPPALLWACSSVVDQGSLDKPEGLSPDVIEFLN
jgi:hypothetical protein